MTGKRMIVTSGDGARQEFIADPALRPSSVSPISRVFPIVPLNLSQRIVANSTIPSNSGSTERPGVDEPEAGARDRHFPGHALWPGRYRRLLPGIRNGAAVDLVLPRTEYPFQ